MVAAPSDSGSSFKLYISGAASAAETVSLTAYDASLTGTTPIGQETASYSASMGASASTMASNLASSINSVMGSNLGVSATSSGSVVTINTSPSKATSFTSARVGTGTTISINDSAGTSSSVDIGGTPRNGDVVSITAFDDSLTGTTPVGQETASYTVATGNSTAVVATNLASNINSTMMNIGVLAVAHGSTISITKYPTRFKGSPTGTEFVQVDVTSGYAQTAHMRGIPATGDVVSVTLYDPGNIGFPFTKTASYTVASGDTLTNIANGLYTQINSVMSSYFTSVSQSGADISLTKVYSTGTLTWNVVVAPGNEGVVAYDSASATATISDNPPVGQVVSFTAYNPVLTGTSPVGQETASYTVLTGNNAATVATNLASSINSTMSNIGVSASASGSVISITTPSDRAATFSCDAPGNDETIALSGSTPIADLHKQLYYFYDCAGNRTGVQGDSSGSFPSGLSTDATKYSYNNLNQLTAKAAGGPIKFEGTTTNPIKALAANQSQVATVASSSSLAGDTLWIIVHDKALSKAEAVKFVVASNGDSATTIATGMKNAINADTTLSTLGVTATSSGAVITISSTSVNATTYTSSVTSGSETIAFSGGTSAQGTVSPTEAFSAVPVLATGANTTSLTAVSGGGTAATTTYPITINSGSSSSYSYDSNGNMTSDGTNSYDWDAEDRLIKITYPGSGNSSQFVYDPMGRCVKIVETVASSVTSTKQFVWCGSSRCEERDGSGSLSNGKQFFCGGQVNFAGGTPASYFYTMDHLGSVRELTDSSGNVKTRYGYDPYGQATETFVSGTVKSDFQYAGYFHHNAGFGLNLNLTATRAYNPALDRFISRDILGEKFGNRYAYVNNNPTGDIDPMGLRGLTSAEKSFVKSNFGNCLDPDKINIFGTSMSGVSLPGGVIFLNSSIYGQELNFSDPNVQTGFAHELFHQLQANALMNVLGPVDGATAYIGAGLVNQGLARTPTNKWINVNPYDYKNGVTLPTNFETQAEAFGDQIGGKTNPLGAGLQSLIKAICGCQ